MKLYKIIALFLVASMFFPLTIFAELDQQQDEAQGEVTEEAEQSEQTEQEESSDEEDQEVKLQEKSAYPNSQKENDEDTLQEMELEEGQRDDRMIEIKQILNTIGFGGILETTYFGEYTAEKVKEFQNYYQLASTATIDNTTYNKLKEVYDSPSEGTTSEAVLEMKEMLNRIRFGGIIESRYFGEYTTKKLQDFQSYYDLKSNGILEEKTKAKLEELKAEPQEGMRSSSIIEIKEILNNIGFGGILETEYFGEYTTKKVKEFQTYHHLRAHGIVDKITYNQMKEVNDSPFSKGDRNPLISDFKVTLNQLGFSGIKVTDYYGGYTEKKVKEFQRYYDLTVDGMVGAKTREKIESLEKAPQLGKSHKKTIEIKEKLNRIGYGGIKVTRYFGDYTEKKVKEFQKANGLKVNGVADDVTIKTLEELSKSLQEGDRSEAIASMKKKLNRIGFSGILETSYFGSFTTKRLKEFQRYYSLSADGVAGPKTLAKLNEVYQSPKKGDQNSAITNMKKSLNKLGFSGIRVTTYFGDFTEKRLKEFQRYYNLKANGILDGKTATELKSNANSSIQKSKKNNQIKSFKQDLDRAGFGGSIISTYLGDYTEGKVKEFQRYYGLKVNGIAEKKTIDTMKDVIAYKLPRKTYNTVNGRQTYSYNDMRNDIDRLTFLYPNLVETKTIGKSVDGRNIYAIKLGNGNKEVFYNASHHAREHMTTNVLMNMVDEYARSYSRLDKYNGYDTQRILNEVSMWFVPMVNPDGVMLVQQGASSAKNPSKVISLNNGSRDFKHWKANVRGVDLNRQYPYLWRTVTNNPGKPSSAFYKGKAPLSEPEAKAVYNFTNQHNFRAAVAYHSSGELIYTRHGYSSHTRTIASGVKSLTGYTPIDLQSSKSGGGYTDWFLNAKKLPAITPEISPYVGERPVPIRNWNSIWNENKKVGLYIANYARLNQ